MAARVASDMVARIGPQKLSSSEQQPPLSDPLACSLESSLLCLDMPKLRQQLAHQPPAVAEKSPLKLALESNSFKGLTRNDKAAITRAVEDVSMAADMRQVAWQYGSSASAAGGMAVWQQRQRGSPSAAARG